MNALWTRATLVLVLGISPLSAASADDGDLDPDFGSFGPGVEMVTHPSSFAQLPGDLVVDSQGEIVALTGLDDAMAPNRGFFVCSRAPNGAAGDPCTAIQFDDVANGADTPYALAIDADDRRIAVGAAQKVASPGTATRIAVAAVDAANSLDTTFGGGDGRVTINLPGTAEARAVTTLPDGRIVYAGSTENGLSTDIVVGMLQSDGDPDASFDGDGRRVIALNNGGDEFDAAYAIAYDDRANRILVAGVEEGVAFDYDFVILALDLDGSFDNTFSGDGIAGVAFDLSGFQDDVATALTVDRFGRILVAGLAYAGSFPKAAVARFLPNGSLDPSFGVAGAFTFQFNTSFDIRAVTDTRVLPQPGEGILIAGAFDPTSFALRQGFVVVLKANGSGFDPAFPNDGSGRRALPLGFDPSTHEMLGAALQHGKIVAGTTFDPSHDESTMYVRYSMSTIFGDDFEAADDSAWSSLQSPD